MLTFKKGDIFQSTCQVICNAVNCVGAMGAGLAALFKHKYPDMNQAYIAYCNEKKLKPGGVHVYSLDQNKYIFNVATKDDWLSDSQCSWILAGLKNIGDEARLNNATTIAIPALGCGLGGLDWNHVKSMIEDVAKKHWDGLDVEVYEPL